MVRKQNTLAVPGKIIIQKNYKLTQCT